MIALASATVFTKGNLSANFFQLLFYDVQRRWKILCEAKRKCGECNCASKVYKAINYQPAPFPRDENSVDTAIRYNQAPGALFFQTSWWKTTPASWRGVKRAFFASSPPSSSSRSCIIDLRAAAQISERKVLSKRRQDTSLHLVQFFQRKILMFLKLRWNALRMWTKYVESEIWRHEQWVDYLLLCVDLLATYSA